MDERGCSYYVTIPANENQSQGRYDEGENDFWGVGFIRLIKIIIYEWCFG